MRMVVTLAVVGCSSSPAPERPASAPLVVVADAATDAAPDAGIPDALANAPAWIFRYNTADRVETWTLRQSGELGLVIVESTGGTTRYLGTVVDAKSLTLTLTAGPNKLSLECKRGKLAVGAKCGDKVTKKLDVLDCYHPDFKAPMSFAAAPGLEFVTIDKCSGYRVIAE